MKAFAEWLTKQWKKLTGGADDSSAQTSGGDKGSEGGRTNSKKTGEKSSTIDTETSVGTAAKEAKKNEMRMPYFEPPEYEPGGMPTNHTEAVKAGDLYVKAAGATGPEYIKGILPEQPDPQKVSDPSAQSQELPQDDLQPVESEAAKKMGEQIKDLRLSSPDVLAAIQNDKFLRELADKNNAATSGEGVYTSALTPNLADIRLVVQKAVIRSLPKKSDVVGYGVEDGYMNTIGEYVGEGDKVVIDLNDPESGTGNKKADVVIADSVFQRMTNKDGRFDFTMRPQQFKKAKGNLRKKGVFVYIGKQGPEHSRDGDWLRRERNAEAWATFQMNEGMPAKDTTPISGMASKELEEEMLADQFEYVYRVGSGGNFSAYYAGDDLKSIVNMISNTNAVSSKYGERGEGWVAGMLPEDETIAYTALGEGGDMSNGAKFRMADGTGVSIKDLKSEAGQLGGRAFLIVNRNGEEHGYAVTPNGRVVHLGLKVQMVPEHALAVGDWIKPLGGYHMTFSKLISGVSKSRANLNTIPFIDPDQVRHLLGPAGIAIGETKSIAEMFEAARRVSASDLLDFSVPMPVEVRMAGLVNLLKAAADNFDEAAERGLSPEATPEEWDALIRAARTYQQIFIARLLTHKQTGRAMSVLSHEKRHYSLSTEDERQISGMLGDIADSDDPKKVNDLVRRIKATERARSERQVRALLAPKSRLNRWVYMIWYDNLLSSVGTHEFNIMANVASAGLNLVDELTTVALTKMQGGDDANMDDMRAMSLGMWKGSAKVWDGIRETYNLEMLRPSDVPEGEGMGAIAQAQFMHSDSKWGDDERLTDQSSTEFHKALEHWGFIFSRALRYEDVVFKFILFNGRIHQLANKKVREMGLRGSDGERMFKKIVDDPDADMTNEALDYAKEIVFQDDGGEIVRALSNFTYSIPLGRFVIPFSRIMGAILQSVRRRTPLEMLSKEWRDDYERGGHYRRRRIAEMLNGSMLIGFALALIESGRITGPEPEDEKVRNLWRAAGNQPYSMKIGDKWYDYSRMEPFGTLFMVTADLHQKWVVEDRLEEGDLADDLASTIFLIPQTINEKTVGIGLQGAIDVIEGNPSGWLNNAVATLVIPKARMWAYIASQQDKHMRATRPEKDEPASGLLNKIAYALPGIRENLPVRHNVLGEPVANTMQGIVPFRVSEAQSHWIYPLVERGIGVGMPNRRVGTYFMTNKEYEDVLVERGKVLNPILKDIIKGLEKKPIPKHELQNLIDDIVREMTEVALNVTGVTVKAIESDQRELEKLYNTPN